MRCSASDSGAGLARNTDQQFNAVTAVPAGTVSTDAAARPQRICDQVGNCTASPAVPGFRVDLAAPISHCGSAPTSWVKGSVGSVHCTVTDTGSGLAARTPKTVTLTTSIKRGGEGVASTPSRKLCDVAGNCVTVGPFGLHLDDAAPAVSCAPVPAAWQAAAVSVQCSASDTGSGLVAGQPTTITLTAGTAEGTTTSHLTLPRHTFCDEVGHCARTPILTGGRVDRQAPLAHCQQPPAGVQRGQVSIRCSVTDLGSGLADSGQATLVLRTDVPAGRAVHHAATSSTVVCDAVDNCTTVGPLFADVDLTRAPAAPPPQFAMSSYTVRVDATVPGSADRITVPYPLPRATGENPLVSCAPAPGVSVTAGTTVAACTATDAAGRRTQLPVTIQTRLVPGGSPGTAQPGETWLIAGSGFAPRAAVTVLLDGAPMGAVTADPAGDALARFAIPAGTPPGSHQLGMSGAASAGALVVLDDVSVSLNRHTAPPTYSGRLGRLIHAGRVSQIRTSTPAVVTGGVAFGGGAPMRTPQSTTSNAGAAKSPSSDDRWLLLALLAVAVLAAVAALLIWRRRTHPNNGGAS